MNGFLDEMQYFEPKHDVSLPPSEAGIVITDQVTEHAGAKDVF